jgi:predicted helicase
LPSGVIFPRCKPTTEFPPSWPAAPAKTLVALWVAEHIANTGGASVPASRAGNVQEPARQEPRPTNAGCKILVLLPSLALLCQSLHEWLRETDLPNLAYLCVCSDACAL